MAIDEDNNLPIEIDGGDQAIIGTDTYSYSGQTAHAQVMKISWGDDTVVTRATENTPLPVKVFGLTGALSTVTVTGAVRGLGSFTVANTISTPIYVTGGVVSYVQGITGSVPVAVTGGVNLLSSIGITGYVSITGGRALTAGTDSIRVTGSVSRLWSLNSAEDSVKVWSATGGVYVPVSLFAGGTYIGASGDALNVNIVGAGISANISIASNIGVQNVAGDVLRVQGTGGGTPIPVTLSTPPTVYLANSAENSTTNPLFVDVTPTSVTINSPWNKYNEANGIQKLLIANKLGGNVLHSAGQWLSFLWDAVGEKNSTEGGTIQDKLNKIVNGQATIKSRIDSTNDPLGAEVKIWNLNSSNDYISPLNPIGLMTTARTGYMYINNSDADILLTTDKYLSDTFGIFCGQIGVDCSAYPGVSNAGGVLTLTAQAYNQYMANGGYLLEANTSAFLPIKFNRYILIPSGSVNTGTLTVIIS